MLASNVGGVDLHPLAGLGQHPTQDLLDLVELLEPRDQQGGDSWITRVAAIVGAADQAAAR